MKKEELMIGDYVYDGTVSLENESITLLPTKVMALGEGLAQIDMLDGRYKLCEYAEIKPIPLTPEILEKNGFESYSHESNLIWGIKTAAGRWVLAYMDYYWEFTMDATIYKRIKIRYLHELQHALKLCNIDKEIEL